MPKKIMIYGSCVSRDAFDIIGQDKYSVASYISRTSLATLESPLEVNETQLQKIPSPFQRRMVRGDMEKSLVTTILANSFDVLILDFMDERFDLERLPSGHLRTLSSEYLDHVKETSSGALIGAQSDEKFDLWKHGWANLIGQLRDAGHLGKVVVNKIYCAEAFGDGRLLFNGSITDIRKMNAFLDRMYEHIEEMYPEVRWVTYPQEVLRADPDHKGGVAPYHFQESFYKHLLNSLPQAPVVKTKVSVIIPCYNAQGKIGRCLSSLRQIDLASKDFEVIFVDDCSTDGTFETLTTLCAETPNWLAVRMEANTGSPSEPRNRGMREAQGEYVFFLDCDDEILPDTLRLHLEHAQRSDADIVRGHLIVENPNGRMVLNRIEDWSDRLDKADRIRLIIGRQSTTNTSLIRLNFLRKAGVTWRSDIRMGEDTLFLTNVLAIAERIEYIDHPTFVYVKSVSFTPSSTQSYGDRELRDHLMVWIDVIAALAPLGVDYVSLRLQVALQTALKALIFVNRGDVSEETFRDFSNFLGSHGNRIDRFGFSRRLKDLIAVAKAGEFKHFQRACRPRLVIAGHDLKFILPMLPQLERIYDVRLDEWKGHDSHDERASRDALEWAELIWCEWLLGNAVWYSKNKKPHQKLIVRMHRFELGRDFGDWIDASKVDAFVCVSTLFLERLLERFPKIPRAKARLQHNFVDVGNYTKCIAPDRRFRLAMIGILPARKGFARALRILQQLRQQDPRYTMDVFSKVIGDLPWLSRIDEERRYFDDCHKMIQDMGLEEAVLFRGHVNVQQELAAHGIGIVLSTSESVRDFPCFESFHLAIADGFGSGGVGLVQYWEGAEFVWPKEFILPTEQEVCARVLAYRDNMELYEKDCKIGMEFVAARYNKKQFLTLFSSFFREFQ